MFIFLKWQEYPYAGTYKKLNIEIFCNYIQMFFWLTNPATPKFWHSYWKPTNADYLRTTPAPPPTVSDIYETKRLTQQNHDQLALFMKAHYGDSDWYLDTGGNWLQKYLEDPAVFVCGLFLKRKGTIVATIFSVPITNGETYIAHSNTGVNSVRVIEGLCVHTQYRKQGLALLMISLMDSMTSQTTPCAHLWSRELTTMPLLSTHIQINQYGYIECAKALQSVTPTQIPWNEWEILWTTFSKQWIDGSSIVTTRPSNTRNGLTVWKMNTDTKTMSYILIVSDTKRRTYYGNHTLWEVVWCGKMDETGLHPSLVDPEYMESVASTLTGIFFTMKEFSSAPFSDRWRISTSGYQAWYIYNYSPPFGQCQIHAIREEI